MANTRDLILASFQIVTGFIRGLRPEQLDQLLDGKAAIGFLPPGARIVTTGPDAAEISKRLQAFETRTEAERFLGDLGLKRAELVSLAKQIGLGGLTKDNMPTIYKRIAETMVGMREDASAMHGQSWR